MVEVSLLELVSIPNTRPVWPSEFAAMVATCEESPNDRTTFGVLADWCDEHNEPELGRAWRWLSKRPPLVDDRGEHVGGVRVEYKSTSYGGWEWMLKGLPGSVTIFKDYRDSSTLAGRVAGLARRLIELDAEIQA